MPEEKIATARSTFAAADSPFAPGQLLGIYVKLEPQTLNLNGWAGDLEVPYK